MKEKRKMENRAGLADRARFEAFSRQWLEPALKEAERRCSREDVRPLLAAAVLTELRKKYAYVTPPANMDYDIREKTNAVFRLTGQNPLLLKYYLESHAFPDAPAAEKPAPEPAAEKPAPEPAAPEEEPVPVAPEEAPAPTAPKEEPAPTAPKEEPAPAGRTGKSKAKWILSIILILAAAIGLWFGWRNYMDRIRTTHPDLSVNSRDIIRYDASEELEKATERYEDEQFLEKAENLESYAASQHKVALVFAGLTTPVEMQKIVDLLQEYHMKAVFACDGVSASEIPDTVNEIRTAGNIIANYGLNKEKHWDQLDDETILGNVARTQAILKRVSGAYPDYVIGNATAADDRILHLTACADIDYYISPNRFINSSSFADFGEALGFVEGISGGSIICIKIDDYLDAIEYEDFEVDDRPDDDKQPSVNTGERVELSIIEQIALLLEALDITETAVVPIDALYTEPDPAIEKLFEDKESASDYEIAESAVQDPAFLENALFIGDSLTLALSYYPVVDPNAQFCAYKSITPMQFVNNLIVTDSDGNEVAVWDEVCGKHPDRIYMLLGTNALASGNNSTFLLYYEKLIDMLKEQFPDVPIYIEGMPPVTKSVSNTRVTLNNGRIRKVNAEIAKMASEKNCYYIDLYSTLADADKALPTEISQEDGIHMNQQGCQMWIDYLLNHRAKEDNEH